jgi:hypothetical protein
MSKSKVIFKNSVGYVLQVTLGTDVVTDRNKRKLFIGNTIDEARSKENAYFDSIRNA